MFVIRSSYQPQIYRIYPTDYNFEVMILLLAFMLPTDKFRGYSQETHTASEITIRLFLLSFDEFIPWFSITNYPSRCMILSDKGRDILLVTQSKEQTNRSKCFKISEIVPAISRGSRC